MCPNDHHDPLSQRQPVNNLLLVPTQFELNFIDELWPQLQELSKPTSNPRRGQLQVELCGFGLVVAAAQTARLLHQYSPKQVVLLGIAGGYCSPADIGTALMFSEVSCYGIGVGTGSLFQSASQMGWQQWPSDDPNKAIGDSIDLGKPSAEQSRHRLLSVTAAAEGRQDVTLRRNRDPNAIAEDMEGFAVAAACRLSRIPLTIIRGISNLAGDRDKVNWKIREAMKAAVELTQSLILDSEPDRNQS